MVVGAYALATHGLPRSTADFDIWVNPTPENSAKVYRALAVFEAPLTDVTPIDFAEEGVIFQIGVVPCRIDIITKISGDFQRHIPKQKSFNWMMCRCQSYHLAIS